MPGPPAGTRFPLPLANGPKLTPDQWRQIAYGEWRQHVSEADAGVAHAENVAACRAAVEEFKALGKIKILVVHSSGRSSARSAANELSNSQLLLRHGLAALEDEPIPEGYEVDEVCLRDYNISPCDACFLSPDVKVYGVGGWRRLGDFRKYKGAIPAALNRHGEFAHVRATPRPTYTGDAYTVRYRVLDREFEVEVTADHRFFTPGGASVRADGLAPGDRLAWVGLAGEGSGGAIRLPDTRPPDAPHAGGYKTFECPVTAVTRRPVEGVTTYCLTMVGDPSFVIDGGLASHNCYSTSSACCTFPCSAFPFDPMQALYPKVLRSDLLLLSAPTNQAAMSSRMKLFVDRLISLDGGYFVDADQYAPMDADFRARMIALAQSQQVHYDQRMHNKVAAFFVTNKDDRDTGYTDDNGRKVGSYVLGVAESLYRGFYNFGFAFPRPDFYVAFRAIPQEDLSFDKQRLSEATVVQDRAKALVRAAIARVREVREKPLPPAVCPPGRT